MNRHLEKTETTVYVVYKHSIKPNKTSYGYLRKAFHILSISRISLCNFSKLITISFDRLHNKPCYVFVTNQCIPLGPFLPAFYKSPFALLFVYEHERRICF